MSNILVHVVWVGFSLGYGKCLADVPSKSEYEMIEEEPGVVFPVDKQCELVFGEGSKICPYMVGNIIRVVSFNTVIINTLQIVISTFFQTASLQTTVVHQSSGDRQWLPNTTHALG